MLENEFYGYVSSNGLLLRIIFHKCNICNFCPICELCECVTITITIPIMICTSSSIFLLQKMICHTNNIYFTKLSKIFSTLFTFIIFVSIMNNFDVCFEINMVREGFFTRITFVIFLAFVNCFYVFSDYKDRPEKIPDILLVIFFQNSFVMFCRFIYFFRNNMFQNDRFKKSISSGKQTFKY